MIVLITGPVRSGKSARAASVARRLGGPVTYVGTARVDPSDPEMTARVARHRAERPDMASLELWQAGRADLAGVVAAAAAGTTLLIDSLGTWIAGELLDMEDRAERDPVGTLALLERRTQPFLDGLPSARADVVLVGEETGWGLVPPAPLGRIFRDHLGRVAQAVGRHAERIELVIAGRALDLRALGVPIDA